MKSFPLSIARGLEFPVYEHDLTQRYPAIALPEGPKDELVLPDGHLAYFTRSLADADKVDVLVLGYSALDTEVLDLIAQSNTQVRRLTIVNRDPASALDVYRAIEQHGIEAMWPDTFDGSYEDWIDREGLRHWVDEFGGIDGGPYPSLTSPHELAIRISSEAAEQRLGDVPRERISRRQR